MPNPVEPNSPAPGIPNRASPPGAGPNSTLAERIRVSLSPDHPWYCWSRAKREAALARLHGQLTNLTQLLHRYPGASTVQLRAEYARAHLGPTPTVRGFHNWLQRGVSLGLFRTEVESLGRYGRRRTWWLAEAP